MAKKEVTGTCRICGLHGKMSAEHIPPQAAFNNKRIYVGQPANGLPFGLDDMINRKVVQGGFKLYTLCESCNNKTGHWYGSDFVDWCHTGMSIIERSKGKPTLVYCYRVHPLRILKQIVTMFFSLVGPEFHKYELDLVKFVLDKHERYLPLDYRFFVYYSAGTRLDHLRYTEPMMIMNIETGQHRFFSEITFPPFGYVMIMNKAEPPDHRQVEITHFSNYGYDAVQDIELPLPVLSTHLRLAGDYRKVD